MRQMETTRGGGASRIVTVRENGMEGLIETTRHEGIRDGRAPRNGLLVRNVANSMKRRANVVNSARSTQKAG